MTNSHLNRSVSRCLNIDNSLTDMAMEELSFYDDDSTTMSQLEEYMPPVLNLLPPECSARRFQIIESTIGVNANELNGGVSCGSICDSDVTTNNSTVNINTISNSNSNSTASTVGHHSNNNIVNKYLQSSQQVVNNRSNSSSILHSSTNVTSISSNGTTTSSAATRTANRNLFTGNSNSSSSANCGNTIIPTTAATVAATRNLRMFHSLSSGSVESSMDDEYMDLFEMESLEEHLNSETNINFPSDLNSLISGHIKNSSPQLQYVIKSPEMMRRPSVRRCLSMTDNIQQPKTPEYLNKINPDKIDNTTPFSSRTNSITTTATQISLSLSPSITTNNCFKRPEPPNSAINSPIQNKRYRGGAEKENLDGAFTLFQTSSTTKTTMSLSATSSKTTIARPQLRKCISMNDAEILSALARSDSTDEPDLIGDFSKPFALPLMEGRHRDLKSISSDTVARLLCGHYDDMVGKYHIIDCRYPYEFEGGHIRGAKNLYTQEQIIEEFLTLAKTDEHEQFKNNNNNNSNTNNVNDEEAGNNKRNIIIFHCEFSSERGPKLSRFLRNNDRARNTNSYPALSYPEIYLLHNGYKEFYETHKELCVPIAYRPMLEPSYTEAYRHFRTKSKSWNGDGLGGGSSRLKKSRSRLML